LILWDF